MHRDSGNLILREPQANLRVDSNRGILCDRALDVFNSTWRNTDAYVQFNALALTRAQNKTK